MKRSADEQALITYRRLISLALNSVRRWSPDIKTYVVTDNPGMFQDVGHEIVAAEFTHRAELYSKFSASLYILDAFRAISELLLDEDVVLFIDPDCLVVGALDDLALTTASHEIVALTMRYPLHYAINGLSIYSATALSERLLQRPCPAVHYGGEFYGFTGRGLRTVLPMIESAFLDARKRSLTDQNKWFTTEEHIISHALRGLGPEVMDASNYVKRVWTASRYNNVDGTEYSLAIWHLPAEKSKGLLTLSRTAQDPASWFWTSTREQFLRKSALVVGIDRSRRRRIRDAGVQIILKVTGMFRLGEKP